MSFFEEMTVFVRAVDAGSFTGAAERMGIAKSVVSRRMSQLEARLGVSLFNRTTRKLSLTEVGQAFHQRAQQILGDVAETQDAIRSLHGELAGKLRVAAPMSFGTRHLSPAIATFMRTHPRLEVDLELNDRQVDLVSEGFDLAIRIGRLKDSTLVARLLAPCRRVVCASPAYLAEHGTPSAPEDLKTHACLSYANHALSEQWPFLIDGEERPVRVVSRLSVNNGDVLADAAVEGLGVIVMPTFIIADRIASGALKVILSDYELTKPNIYAVWPPNRELSAKVRAFVEHLARRFAGTPYWDQTVQDSGL